MNKILPLFALALVASGPGLLAQSPVPAPTVVPTIAAPKVDAPATAPRLADEKAVESLLAAFVKAFNAGDAEAAAATYSGSALVVDEHGARTEGRAAIKDQYAGSFAENPGSTIAIEVEALRFLGPDTAIEVGRTTITPRGDEAPEVTRFTAVYTREGGRWLQSAVRDEVARGLAPRDHLKALEWLVGDWVNESQDAVVTTSCKWAVGGNFLDRDFTMKTKGRPVLSGTQRIGWDPLKHQFKTWIFDSEGGHGEGFWTRDGDRWLIKVEGVNPQGQPISATNIITRMGKDRMGWMSTERTIGSAAIPEVEEFVVVRTPPEVGK